MAGLWDSNFPRGSLVNADLGIGCQVPSNRLVETSLIAFGIFWRLFLDFVGFSPI